MIATLAKKAEALETAFWAKAEPIRSPTEQSFFDFYVSVWPLGNVVYDRWLKSDPEANRMRDRMGRLEGSNLSLHPAFLKDEHETLRRSQWLTYHSRDYRELRDRFFERFMAEAAPLYDVKAMGLCGVALRLYEKEFDEWMAQHEYIGSPVSREEMACNQVELHIISDRIQRAAGYPEDQKTLDELWRRAIIEQIDYCYGRKMTEEELLLDWEKWKQVREDMAAGKPASKSEAARYLREMDEQYPRKSGLRTYRPDEVSKF